ncbi:MAG: PAS domain S-box protein [Bacteroidia bacterium]
MSKKIFISKQLSSSSDLFIKLAEEIYKGSFSVTESISATDEVVYFNFQTISQAVTVFEDALDTQIIIAICDYEYLDEALKLERLDSIILTSDINKGVLKLVMAQAEKNRENRLENIKRKKPTEYSIQFGEYLEHAPIPVFITQNDLVVYLNNAGRKALDFEGEFPFSMERFIHPEDVHTIIRYKKESEVDPAKIKSYDIRFINAQNEIIYGQMTLSKILYKNEIATIGSVLDITKRKKALDDLKISESILKQAQRLSNTGTFTVNIKSKEVWCSSQLKELFDKQDVSDDNCKNIEDFSQIVFEDDKTNFIDTVNRTLNTGQYASTSFRSKNSKGILNQFQLKCEPILEGSLILGTIQDITEHVLFEKRISQQEKITNEILNSFPFDVAIYNPDFTYQFVNEKAVSDREKRKSIIGKTDLEYFESVEGDILLATNRIKMLQNAIDSKTVVNFKENIVKPNINKVLLRSVAPIYEDEKLIKLIGTSIDLTKESQIEKNLEFRVNFERLLISLSNRLINISIDEIDKVVGEGLEQIGDLVGVDRVYIFKYSSNRAFASNTHEWCAPNIESFSKRLQNLEINKFEHLETSLAAGNIYIIDDVSELPETAKYEIEEFEREDIKSIIVAPIIVSRNRIGFIGFDSVKKKRIWTTEIADMIRMGAQIISSAFERKSTLNAILNSEEKFRTLSEKAHAAIFITRDSRFVYANPETCKLTGYSLDEILTENIIDILAPEERQSAETNQKQIMQFDNYSTRNERKLFTKNGDVKYIDITSNRIFYNGENAMISIAFDVTQKHKQEEERIALIEQLTMQNQDLEQFSYITSHNLRSPVAGIKGLTSIIDKNQLGNELNKGIVDRIESAASKLDRVIQDLNEIISVKKTTTLNKQEVYFENLIDEFKESHSELIKDAKASFVLDFKEADHVFSVRSYVNSILSNLITNAIKYQKPGIPPIIEIRTKKAQNQIELFVKDNGLGIDLGKHGNKLFKFKQRFHLNIEGHGIGLYLVKTQTLAIGGTVLVQSTVNEGSTFIVNIPI